MPGDRVPVRGLEVQEEAGDEDGGEPAKSGARSEECQVRAVLRYRRGGAERDVRLGEAGDVADVVHGELNLRERRALSGRRDI